MLSIHYRPPRTKATSLPFSLASMWPTGDWHIACLATKRPQCRCQEVHLNRPSFPVGPGKVQGPFLLKKGFQISIFFSPLTVAFTLV